MDDVDLFELYILRCYAKGTEPTRQDYLNLLDQRILLKKKLGIKYDLTTATESHML